MSFGFSGFGGGKSGTTIIENGSPPTPLSSVLDSESISTAATSKAAKQLNDKISNLNQKMAEVDVAILSVIDAGTFEDTADGAAIDGGVF